ncbi:hypothetical protein Q0590_24880 [Rhodocytophaga aerolata]|uniref:DNA adenine methylase n=1 Tax=Rhodocytophaga aerolata TaxID=455078 RepID=A0ABT8RBU2_9BACT|nr:hypothetical protein [Rhodocytophaga aerolata]MDO1449535.1 hypothetical protein [Rhodocytophaga aerolata]
MIKKIIPAKVEGLSHFKGGSKNYFQPVINLIRPHDTLIVPFLGNCAVVQNIKACKRTIGNDIDYEVIHKWKQMNFDWIELWNADYMEFLQALDFTTLGRVVLYVDPPMPPMIKSSDRPKYRYEVSEQGHEQLLDYLCSLPTGIDIVVTCHANRLYQRKLSHFGRTMFTYYAGKRQIEEWLWCNYDLNVSSLHDYNYVGDTADERYLIKVKADRLTERLLKEGPLQAQAILSRMKENIIRSNTERIEQETHTIESGRQWYENREQPSSL